MIFEGAIATKAILEANNRDIDYIMIDEKKKDRNTNYIINLANKKNIKIEFRSRDKIDELSSGKTHGGIIISANQRKYQTLNNINLKENIFLIDGIEDPFNLGYAIRSLYAFNINTIILKDTHLISSDNIIVKSSAGASEKINIVISDDIIKDIKYLKSKDYLLSVLKRSDDSKIYFKSDLTKKIIYAIGGEKRGLSKDVEALSDLNLYIPYSSKFKNALNLTSAIVTIASEVHRQNYK